MKKFIVNTLSVLALSFFLVSCNNDDDNPVASQIALGSEVTVNNTFQASAFGIDNETDFAVLSGMNAGDFSANATVSNSVEFPAYIGLYDIDISENSISFELIATADDPNFGSLFRTLEKGTFDRYYFTFNETQNVNGFTSSNASVNLRIDAANVLVVEIGEGYDFNPDQAFTITLN